jgi:hypothetical protein
MISDMLKLKFGDYTVLLVDEPTYSLESVDNIREYADEYVLSDDSYFGSKHGLQILEGERLLTSCILIASGGPTKIHSQSAIIVQDNIYVAVGNMVCSLNLPSLKLKWWQKVDFATCCGIYHLSAEGAVITHGECDISKFSESGELIWSKSGKDIFTEGFEIKGNYIRAIDFNHEEYRIRLTDGQISLDSEI